MIQHPISLVRVPSTHLLQRYLLRRRRRERRFHLGWGTRRTHLYALFLVLEACPVVSILVLACPVTTEHHLTGAIRTVGQRIGPTAIHGGRSDRHVERNHSTLYNHGDDFVKSMLRDGLHSDTSLKRVCPPGPRTAGLALGPQFGNSRRYRDRPDDRYSLTYVCPESLNEPVLSTPFG